MAAQHQPCSAERRNDIGMKIYPAIILACVLGFAGFAWAQAMKGETKADQAIAMVNTQALEIASMKGDMKYILKGIDDIKASLKHPRRINGND